MQNFLRSFSSRFCFFRIPLSSRYHFSPSFFFTLSLFCALFSSCFCFFRALFSSPFCFLGYFFCFHFSHALFSSSFHFFARLCFFALFFFALMIFLRFCFFVLFFLWAFGSLLLHARERKPQKSTRPAPTSGCYWAWLQQNQFRNLRKNCHPMLCSRHKIHTRPSAARKLFPSRSLFLWTTKALPSPRYTILTLGPYSIHAGANF